MRLASVLIGTLLLAGCYTSETAVLAPADGMQVAGISEGVYCHAENRLLLADIGHWESEQFTIDLLADHLSGKFPTFAVLKTGVKTNPVEYFR